MWKNEIGHWNGSSARKRGEEAIAELSGNYPQKAVTARLTVRR